MHDHSAELSVGDVLQVGDYVVTIVAIEGDEVTFRVEETSPVAHERAQTFRVPR